MAAPDPRHRRRHDATAVLHPRHGPATAPAQLLPERARHHRAPKGSGLHGFGFTAVAGVDKVEGTNRLQYQIRPILNYEIPLL